jgi:hypothetical protein
MPTRALLAAVLLCGSAQAFAQQNHPLRCRGVMGDTPAALSGMRHYVAHNSLGDGYVRFDGTVTAGGISGRIAYEGYTRTAPFEGVIATPNGAMRIAVLDNTGGQMIIYSGGPSLGAPHSIGQFVCSWG